MIFRGARDLDMTDAWASPWRQRHPWLYDGITGALCLACIGLACAAMAVFA